MAVKSGSTVQYVCSIKHQHSFARFLLYSVHETLLFSPLLQAISFELLALYTRPLKMLDTLEKEVSALREKQAQKEANLKKIASAGNYSIVKATTFVLYFS